MWMKVQMSFLEEEGGRVLAVWYVRGVYLAAASLCRRGLDLLLLVMRLGGKAFCGLLRMEMVQIFCVCLTLDGAVVPVLYES